jgi:hypothetical protein
VISLISLKDGAIEGSCNNDTYLCIFNLSYDFDPQQPDYHFQYSLQACCIQLSPIIWIKHHVKGDQDETINGPLDYWAVLNIIMDQMARILAAPR